MMKRPLLFLLLFSCIHYSLSAQVGVGEWRDHLPYRDVEILADVGDNVFCATAVSLFSVNKDNGEVVRYNRVNGLSDVRITSMAYDQETEVLVVGYANGNLDLFKGSRVVNLSDIKRSDIIGDKGVYDIEFREGLAWLSTGFGIVQVNTEREEIADTYLIAPGAATIRINSIGFHEGQIYAATDAGIRTALETANLADFNSWAWDLSAPQDSGYSNIQNFGQDFFILREDDSTVLRLVGGAWTPFGPLVGKDVRHISAYESTILFTEPFAMRRFDENLNALEIFDTYAFTDSRRMNASLLTAEGLFIGDEFSGLVDARTFGQEYSVLPNGPYSPNSWQMTATPGRVWVAHGGVQNNWNNQFINDQSSGLVGSEWVSLKGKDGFQSVRDHMNVLVDPINEDRLFISSWREGLVSYNVLSEQAEILNNQMSTAPIAESEQNPGRYQSAGADFDAAGNLWVTNSYTEAPLKMRRPNGEWLEFSCPGELTTNSLLGEIVCAEGGINWVVMPRSVGLFAYSTNGTTEDMSDDDCKRFSTAVGDGQLPTPNIFSVAEDLDGEIWIGTSQGPAVNYSPQSIFSNNPLDFQQILVEQDGNVEILLGSEIITCIAIDGANRKWFGTQGGGAFLISEDGGEEIIHFTTENSPLLSDELKDIVIEPQTGEVFFATDNGIVSYRGDATGGQFESECISVFPNPVRENYSGPITIDGLVADSDVKITDVAGNIVFQTRSNGGRAVWNGTDFSGSRVQTGVYFAHSVSPDGESACTSKILLVN